MTGMTGMTGFYQIGGGKKGFSKKKNFQKYFSPYRFFRDPSASYPSYLHVVTSY